MPCAAFQGQPAASRHASIPRWKTCQNHRQVAWLWWPCTTPLFSIHSLLRRLDYAIAIIFFLPGKNGEGSLKIGIIFQIKMVEKNACIYLYHFISGMQVVYGYYMVVYRPYTVRIPHWLSKWVPKDPPIHFRRFRRFALSSWLRQLSSLNPSLVMKIRQFSGVSLAKYLRRMASMARPGPVGVRIFFGPPRGCFSPMPHQFPRYLQHVKPRSCHICNILEPLEGNCSILELETDGKSSILELETLISAGIGIVWS